MDDTLSWCSPDAPPLPPPIIAPLLFVTVLLSSLLARILRFRGCNSTVFCDCTVDEDVDDVADDGLGALPPPSVSEALPDTEAFAFVGLLVPPFAIFPDEDVLPTPVPPPVPVPLADVLPPLKQCEK